ncbi:probable serine/threonine-protein kinase gdt8 [Cherax quadricarinatus]|uniref:probable serine/threonine-protein kinase gdt8 n=1 Tax=Cherax quadricarinatus TaxID=27406 RepID=UPI00387E85AD
MNLNGSNGIRVNITDVNSTNNTIVHHLDNLLKFRHIIQELLESHCKNATSSVVRELKIILKTNNETGVSHKSKSEDSMAVLYIVFVLFFYAASLLILLLKYLRRERESSRLQQFYDDYMDSKHPSLVVHYDNTGKLLHTQTSTESSGAVPDPTNISTTTHVMLPTFTPSITPTITPSITPTITPDPTPPSSPMDSTLPVYPTEIGQD